MRLKYYKRSAVIFVSRIIRKTEGNESLVSKAKRVETCGRIIPAAYFRVHTRDFLGTFSQSFKTSLSLFPLVDVEPIELLL